MADENANENKLYFVEDQAGEWAMIVGGNDHADAVLAWAGFYEYEGYARAYELPAAGGRGVLDWAAPKYFSAWDPGDPARNRVEEEGDLLKLFEK